MRRTRRGDLDGQALVVGGHGGANRTCLGGPDDQGVGGCLDGGGRRSPSVPSEDTVTIDLLGEQLTCRWRALRDTCARPLGIGQLVARSTTLVRILRGAALE